MTIIFPLVVLFLIGLFVSLSLWGVVGGLIAAGVAGVISLCSLGLAIRRLPDDTWND